MPNDLERMPPDVKNRPYKLYRSSPRGLRSLLRGEQQEQAFRSPPDLEGRSGLRDRLPWSGRRTGGAVATGRRLTPRRVIKYLLIALVLWVGVSFLLFMISAANQAGTIPAAAKAQLSTGGNMLFSA